MFKAMMFRFLLVLAALAMTGCAYLDHNLSMEFDKTYRLARFEENCREYGVTDPGELAACVGAENRSWKERSSGSSAPTIINQHHSAPTIINQHHHAPATCVRDYVTGRCM